MRPTLERLGLSLREWPQGPTTIVLGPSAHWIEVNRAARINLERRGPLLRVLQALLVALETTPGRHVRRGDLVAAAWPGETIKQDAARNRFHATMTSLRRLGLAHAIQSSDGGYLPRPDTVIVRRD